jgi:hypothetical protein
MHPIASQHDYYNLPEAQQEKYAQLFVLLTEQRLSCRCVMVGDDFTVIVAPGYAAPKWWMDRFGIR